MNDNPFELLDEIGRMVEEMEDFNLQDVCHQPNDDYWISIIKDRDLTVLTVMDGYGVRLDVKMSIHFEDAFVLFPIYLKLDILITDYVLRTCLRMLEEGD